MQKKVFLIGVILLMFFSISSITAEGIADGNSTDSVKTYTNLSTEITEIEDGNVLNLTENYGYDVNADDDLIDGVKISKNLTIRGYNDSYIDGANQSRGLYIDSYCSVILENLIFKNCYSNSSGAAIYLADNSNLTIINCTFLNNHVYNSNGGAINAQTGTNVFIHNSLFENSDAIRESELEWDDFKEGMGGALCIGIDSNLLLNSSIFRNNQAYLGLVLVISYDDVRYRMSTLSVRNCTFENNTVRRCGIIYQDELGSGEIVDSVFRNNVLTETGSVLDLDACINTTVRNCQFEENSAKSGGAIRLKVFKSRYVSHVSIINCVFTKNSANNGGAIYSDHGEATIEKCKFYQNTAVKKGGAIYMQSSSVNISNSKFNKNTAANGGAVCLDEHTSIINDCSFYKNTASKNGGAIIAAFGSIDLSDSTFEKNGAANGGAVCLDEQTSMINDCSFYNNVASKNGGAIIAESGFIDLSDSTFEKNGAADGGGLYLNSKGSSVRGCSFTENSASSSGGAIYSTIKVVTISKIKYSGNKASAGSKVYGAFYAKVKLYTHTAKSVKLKIKITSPWKMSVSQKVKVKLKGPKKFTSKWVKTNSKGIVKVIVPFNVKISKYKLTILMKNGVCHVKSWTKVKDQAKITAPKKVKRPSKIKLMIKNKASNALIKNKKFNVKVYTGNDYKSYMLKTNSKGILKIPTSKLAKGTHKIVVLLSNSNYNIENRLKVKIK